MTKDEIIKFRNLLLGVHIRTIHMALTLHKEQERIEDLVRILDTHLIEGKSCQ